MDDNSDMQNLEKKGRFVWDTAIAPPHQLELSSHSQMTHE